MFVVVQIATNDLSALQELSRHVISGIPLRHNISWDEPLLKVELKANLAPSVESDHGRMDDGKRKVSNLDR